MRSGRLYSGGLLLLACVACSGDPLVPASVPDASVTGNGGNPPGSIGATDGGATSGPDGAVVTPTDAGNGDTLVTYGTKYEGGEFHLGPVDWDETQWHNACAPTTKYAPGIRAVEGTLLAGLWNGLPNVSSQCDACIHVTTAKGKSATLRVVTFGSTTPNSIDVSPDAFAILDSGEYPRAMTWQFARCPDTGKILYEFQTGSSEWWTSLWVRNARVPITKVEVKSVNHGSYVALARGTDGTLTDGSGFGKGTFSLRLTGMDGQSIEDTIAWPAAGIAGQTVPGQGNFH